MDWTPLPKGKFTGIQWAADGATTGMDPYLAWAEADGFAGYRAANHGKAPETLPLLIEVKPGKTIQDLKQASHSHWLRIRQAYLDHDTPAGLRYCTALARPEFFAHFRKPPLADVISRFELGLPAGAQASGAPVTGKAAPPPAKLQGKVMGVIDGGLAFANTSFLQAGQARTRYFWRQDDKGVGDIPCGFGYGHELTAAQIDAAMDRCRYGGMVDEEAVYRHFELFDLQRLVNHGTHVTDIACGPLDVTARMANVPSRGGNAPPSWTPAGDGASTAHIVAVQLDWNTILDTSGGSMNVQVMDALMYILSCCDPAARVAVNISWGTLAGPHDGSSVLEAAMDQLIALGQGALAIAVPAGNSYQSRTHANKQLKKGEACSLAWCVQADDRTQSFLELWMADAHGRVPGASIRVTPAGCAPLPWMPLGKSGMWTDADGKPLCALVFPASVATGTTGTCALLALGPSFSFDRNAATVPPGTWTVEIRNDGPDGLVFDAYIERDDVPIGVPGRGGRQSYFTDRDYDTSGNPDSFIDHRDNPTPIRRSGNFNSISTGKCTIPVAGVRVSDGSWSLYSPREDDPDAWRPQRPDVLKVARAKAFSDQSPVASGLPAAGVTSGSIVRLVGTSGAAPQEARRQVDLAATPCPLTSGPEVSSAG